MEISISKAFNSSEEQLKAKKCDTTKTFLIKRIDMSIFSETSFWRKRNTKVFLESI